MRVILVTLMRGKYLIRYLITLSVIFVLEIVFFLIFFVFNWKPLASRGWGFCGYLLQAIIGDNGYYGMCDISKLLYFDSVYSAY